jgi:ubiquinone/menaquinone biosynthesis C-methylase UbiE
VKPVDYEVTQHQHYARGRALQPGQLAAWIAAFAERLPARRPLDGLDLGSGTGRFTPALAAAFGPVTGIEPADRMRAVAEAEARHPDVTYLSGAAAAIPLADAAVDYTLMFLVWHHVPDKRGAARELARVTRPGGRLLLRAQFSDQMPRLWWLDYFPRGPEADASMYQPLAEVIADFESAGWRQADFAMINEPSGETRASKLRRLQLRTLSTFEQLTPEELATGFARLEEAVGADPDVPVPDGKSALLTLVLA